MPRTVPTLLSRSKTAEGLKKDAKAVAKVAGQKAGVLRRKGEEDLDKLLASLSEKVSDVREAISTRADEGAEAIESGVATLVKQSQQGIKKLDRKWQKLDRRQKLAVAGGLIAALAAAAAAPAIARKARKSW